MARSKKAPVTAADKAMSRAHLRESANMNRRHMVAHERAAARAKDQRSEDYHEDHAKKHKKALKEDYDLIKKRSKGGS